MIDDRQLPIDLEIDGGITPETAKEAVAAGARILVAGSAVFNGKNGYKAAIDAIRSAG
jgi:ribulose-phosphate 3-epimerase